MRSPNRFRRAKCKRNQKGGAYAPRQSGAYAPQSGGGLGGSIVFSPSSYLHSINNPLAVTAGSSCDSTSRNLINPSSLGPGGLPGMRGGKRGKKGSRRIRRQRGGGYTTDLANSIFGGSPGLAPMASVISQTTGCSSVGIPSSGASGQLNVPITGPGALLQKGGAMPGLGQSNQALTVTTAGYSVNPPGIAPGVSSSGALFSIRTPYDANAYSPACLRTNQTGGKRKTRKQKKSRKTRKSKKTRKH